jgi:hypothetical protein
LIFEFSMRRGKNANIAITFDHKSGFYNRASDRARPYSHPKFFPARSAARCWHPNFSAGHLETFPDVLRRFGRQRRYGEGGGRQGNSIVDDAFLRESLADIRHAGPKQDRSPARAKRV